MGRVAVAPTNDWSGMSERPKVFPVIGPAGEKPPDYERVVRTLRDEELRHELAAGRGGDGYLDAVRTELRRRDLPAT